MSNIKRIAPHVVTHCTFCKAEGVRGVLSVWRITHHNDTACDAHKPKLMQIKAQDQDIDDGYRTEADYQTWMKL